MFKNSCRRPGGLELTQALLKCVCLAENARILDVGCGEGATVRLLRETYRYDAVGIDLTAEANRPYLVRGDAAHLPWMPESFDAVMLECSLSRMEEPDTVLREIRRVLRPAGAILLSDLYTRGERITFCGQVGRVERLEEQLRRLAAAGFRAGSLAFHDEALISYWASLVFDQGMERACRCLGIDGGRDVSKWGYYSAVLFPPPADQCKLPGGEGYDALMGSAVPPKIREASAGLCRQLEQAAETVDRARRNSPFFRRYLSGYSGADILRAGSLTALPFTDGAMLAERGSEMLCVPLEETARIRTIPTSGSTGQAKRVWFTEAELARTVGFFAEGMRPIVAGGQRVAILMSDTKPYSIASLLREGLRRAGADALILGRPRETEDLYAVPCQCGCIVGLPADVLYLARKRPELRPGSVLLSADYIPQALVESVRAVWGCRVFRHYGMTETGYGLAVQCPALEGQHLRWQDFIVEIIDPDTRKVLPDGCEGEIVLTSLFQGRAVPLIRYRTGDIGSLVEKPCPCGNCRPRLGPVRGRLQNLRTPMNIHRIDDVMFSAPGVAGYWGAYDAAGLHITAEGEVPGWVSEKLKKISHLPVNIRYEEAPPWKMRGKRKLLTDE